ncbi:MAG: YbjQ family protein [Nanoarchaeota archaeon]
MLVATTETVEGKKITENLGLVKGNTVRAKHIGKDIVAGFRNIVGGEIKEYTEMIIEAREDALKRMIEDAKKKGADAIVGTRFTTSMITSGAAELLVYGTAVKVK